MDWLPIRNAYTIPFSSRPTVYSFHRNPIIRQLDCYLCWHFIFIILSLLLLPDAGAMSSHCLGRVMTIVTICDSYSHRLSVTSDWFGVNEGNFVLLMTTHDCTLVRKNESTDFRLIFYRLKFVLCTAQLILIIILLLLSIITRKQVIDELFISFHKLQKQKRLLQCVSRGLLAKHESVSIWNLSVIVINRTDCFITWMYSVDSYGCLVRVDVQHKFAL